MAWHKRSWPVSPRVFPAAAVAAGYFLGSILGLSWQLPSTQISAVWPPNAILLAALLVTPRARWWTCLAAVLPAHFLAQMMMGIPFSVALINFAGNMGDALLGALAIQYFHAEPFGRLRSVVLIMLFGGIVAPALMSFVVAQLFVSSGLSADPWLAWRLRLLTNSLAVFTLVPLLVLVLTKDRPPILDGVPRRGGEAGALLAGLLVIGILVFGLPSGVGESPLLLYLPLPFLLWAAIRFGLAGVCASMLMLTLLSMWGVVRGHGPFAAQHPEQSATSLVLFLNVTCAPLLMLAALLEERRSLDEERRRQATLHTAVLASMHDQIAILDRKGLILQVNQSWASADRPGPGVNYRDVLRAEAQASDGTSMQMLAGVESVLDGDRTSVHLEFLCPDSPGAWWEMSAERLKRPEGGAVITNTEITRRKQAEVETRQQRQELAHLTRVAMLGELSGALAHELNQPLTSILLNAQVAQRMLGQRPADLTEVQEILRDIVEDDRRAGDVIQRLRTMLRKGETKMVPLDLNEVVQEVLHLAHSDLITRNVSMTTQLAPWLPPVRGDRVQLQQVLLNLVLNACEAMSGNQAGERKLTVLTDRDPEKSVRASVVDCGPGIPADELERVFEPFFTTKERGLGLGLSICRSLVAAHGGRLWAGNNEDRGATFYLTLPLQEEDPA